jgi:hypothetical protein
MSDFLPVFDHIWMFSEDFQNVPHIKFHGNPCSVSRADTRAQTERQRDGQKDRHVEGHESNRRVLLLYESG